MNCFAKQKWNLFFENDIFGGILVNFSSEFSIKLIKKSWFTSKFTTQRHFKSYMVKKAVDSGTQGRNYKVSKRPIDWAGIDKSVLRIRFILK